MMLFHIFAILCISLCSAQWDILGSITRPLMQAVGIDPIQATYKLILGLDVETNPSTVTPLPFPTSLKTPSIEEAAYYVHFSAAAYCHGPPLEDWTCYECRQTNPSVKMVKIFQDLQANSLAYITVDDVKREIILTFRGTNNPTNAMQDLNIGKVPAKFGHGEVHRGGVQALGTLYEQMLPILRELIRQHPGVVVTGHSLGAGFATYVYYLLNNDIPGISYAVFTYGEPRIGTKPFADYINSQNIPFARVINEADMIPHFIPFSLGFWQHATEYWTHNGVTKICSQEVYEDPTCSNSIPTPALNIIDHVVYLGTNVGANCVLENPLQSLTEIITG